MSGGVALRQHESNGFAGRVRALALTALLVAGGLFVMATPPVTATSTVTGVCLLSGSTVTCDAAGTGTYTPDAAVTCVKAEAWGGGGGGGGTNANGYAAGGGAGGSYARGFLQVSSPGSYNVNVGAGGAGAPAGNNPGSAGGDSWFSSAATLLAQGGAAGSGSGAAASAAGGAGSTSASVGTVKYAGGDGATGTTTSSAGGGGGAGSNGDGGDASGATGGSGTAQGGGNGASGGPGTNAAAGAPGSSVGGGGSGGMDIAVGSNQPGGNGARGQVVLTEYRPAEQSTLTSSAAGAPAGTATVSVTAALQTPCGPMSGKSVTLTSSRGATDTITGSPATSDATGQAVFTVSSTTCGLATMTARDTTDGFDLLQTVTLGFSTTAAPSATASLVSASPAEQYADNVATSTVTVQLLTAAGCPVFGKSVNLSSSRGATDTITTVQGVTDHAGTAIFNVKSGDWTTANGVSTYTATDATDAVTLAQGATVTWAAPVKGLAFVTQPSDAGQGLPLAPVVRVRALDGSGNAFTAAPVTLRLRLVGGPSGAQLLNGPGMTNTDPVAQATTSAATGIASFPGLAVDRAGTYRLEASFGVTPPRDSQAFVVGKTGPAWAVFHRDAGATGASLAGRADMSTIDLLPALTGQPASSIATTPLVVDIDGDGDLDVVVSTAQANTPAASLAVMAYTQDNGAIASAPAWTTSIPSTMAAGQPATDGLLQLAAADLDLDGQTEVAVYSVYGNAGFGNGALRVLRASDGVLQAGPFGLTIGANVPLSIGNIDGDAQPEIVLMHTVGGLNPGEYMAGLTYAAGAITLEFDTLVSTTGPIAWSNLVLAEVDGANEGLEVVVGGDFGNGLGTLWYCRPLTGSANCGAGIAASDGVHGLALADLNGDGREELVVNERTTLSGTRFALEAWNMQSTSPFLSVLASDAGSEYQWNVPAVADVDGDAKVDVVNVVYSEFARSVDTNRDGHVFVRGYDLGAFVDKGSWSRPGTPATDLESIGGGVLVPVEAASTTAPHFVFGSADGSIHAARTSPVSSVGPAWSTAVAGATAFSPPAVGDLTGDCRPEVVVGASTGGTILVSGIEATAPTASPSFLAPTNFTSDLAPSWGGGTSPGDGLRAKLAWNPLVGFPAAGFQDGGLPVVAYDVYRAPGDADGPTGPYIKVGTWPTGTPPTVGSPFIDDLSDNLVLGVATAEGPGDYHYRVAPVTCFTLANGGALLSEAFHAEVRRPAAPTALSGYPYGGPAYAVPPGGPRVRLNWAPVADNVPRPHGCGAVDGYNIYRSTTSPVALEAANKLNGAPVTATTFLDAVPAYAIYHYAVSAANCVGETASEVSVDVRVPDAPTVFGSPNGATNLLTIAPGTPVPGCADADAPSGWVEGYRVYRSTAPGAPAYLGTLLPTGPTPSPASPWRWLPTPAPDTPTPLLPATATYADTSVVQGTTYYYRVATVNCVGEGTMSAEVAVVTGGAATPPPAIVASLSPSSQSGISSRLFSVTPSVSGGVPTLTCSWSVAPLAGAFTPPGSPCSGVATFTGAPPGTYTVSLTVRDFAAQQVVASATIRVDPDVQVTLSPELVVGPPEMLSTFTPTVTGGEPPVACAWSILPAAPTFEPPSDGSCVPAQFSGGAIGTTYTIRVVATDSTGMSSLDSAQMRVIRNQPPVAEFTSPASAGPGQLVSFSDASYDLDGAIVSWLWEFGDGSSSSLPHATHAYDRGGVYRVRLTVIDNYGARGEATQEISVPFAAEVEAQAGEPGGYGGAAGPVVDAGPDQRVPEGSVVTLAASSPAASATYRWNQADGPLVDLRNANSATPSFTAPLLGGLSRATLRFTVVAVEGGAEGAADAVRIDVVPGNRAPVARAGEALEAEAGSTVTLDASGSSDPDGDKVTYAWRQVEGAFVDLRNASSAKPSFAAPDRPGTLRFQLTVSDGKADTTDTLVVVVRPAVAAVAGFTAERSAAGPLTVVFTADAREGTATWEFGDGNTATGLQVVHTYARPDTYNVTLRHRVGDSEAAGEQPVALGEAKSRSVAGAPAVGIPWPAILGSLGALVAVGLAVAAVAWRRRSQAKSG